MPRCVAPAAVGFALIALSADAQEVSAAPKSALRQFMRDTAKAKVLDVNPAALKPAQAMPATAEPLKMAPFVVDEKRAPKLAGIEEEMRKQKGLESHALYHTEFKGKVRLEIGLPPEPGGKGGGFSLPLLRLSW
jgi:hypothetical protein